MSLTLVTAPASEPLTLEQARTQCRYPAADENNLFEEFLIPAARERCEGATNRALLTQTWDLKLDRFPDCGPIWLPKPPAISVTSVSYVDTTGTTQTWSSTLYQTSIPTGPKAARARIQPAYGEVWPVTRDQMDAVTVRFVAGYGPEAGDVPARLRQWMLLDVGTLYEHRELIVVGSSVSAVPVPNGYLAYKAWPLER